MYLFYLLLIILFSNHSFAGSVGKVEPSITERKKIIEIIKEKEREYKIPTGLLLSIADVESGIRPFSINDSGNHMFFKNKNDMLLYLKKNKKRLDKIDVGVMQINIKYHRHKFKSLEHMIDPYSNIDYAARFLGSLRLYHKSWWLAVGAYHNVNNKVNIPYKEKVFKSWQKIKRKILFSKI